jgi:CHASE2 domain-containing sensor protein
MLARFQREAEALGQLEHPNIVNVSDCGVDPETGRPYLVTEYLEGESLEELCRRGAVSLHVALPILEAIGRAIDHAHRCGILHRDLKPANVLLSSAPDASLTPKVLDFGLAQFLERPAPEAGHEATRAVAGGEIATRVTPSSLLIGTPIYVAPELIDGAEATVRSDIYSFGVLAYELLVGRPPFLGSVAQVLEGHLQREPPDPRSLGVALPAEVVEALAAPLQKDSGRRPPTAAEVVDGIRRAAEAVARREWRRRELPGRAWLAAGLTSLAALSGAALAASPFGRAVEGALIDTRVALHPARQPDPRIVLVTVDEETLEADATSLADRGEEFGRLLERVFATGARGVAIDLLLPARFARAPAFAELILRHPETLTLAALSSPRGARVVGLECIDVLTAAALGPQRTMSLFGFVNVDEDVDGAVRRARTVYSTEDGRLQFSWAGRAAGPVGARPAAAGRFTIDTTVDWRRFDRISWRHLTVAVAQTPDRFRGRLVLVGGDFLGSGDDEHRIATARAVPGKVSGLVLQALTVDTILSGFPVRTLPSVPVLLAVSMATLLIVLRLLVSAKRMSVLSGAPVAVLVVAAFALFRGWGVLIPTLAPALTLVLGILGALAARAWLHGSQA